MIINIGGLSNARDLCYLTGIDGRKIKKGRVIRSDNLSRLDGKGCEFLREYGLKRVVDLRTQAEIDSAPDKMIEGAEWIQNPILESLTEGITRKEDKEAQSLEEILLNFSVSLGVAGVEWLRSLYIPLVSHEFSLKGYRRLMDILKDNRDGAVLYHCSAGKDRVGVGTAIFLSLLGVDRRDIINDYLLTNNSYRDVISRSEELGRKRGVSEEIIATIQPLSGVDISYINQAFSIIDSMGGIEAFAKNQLGIDEKYIEELRTNYLE